MIIPAHKSADKQRTVMALYGDKKDVMARESLGIATSGATGKFAKHAIELLFKSPCIPVDQCAGPVYVAINPNGGQSGYTIVSGCYISAKLVIVGMDMTHITNFSETRKFVQDHLHKLRHNFRHCMDTLRVILIPESSLGHEAAQIMLATKNIPGVSCCCETKQGTKWGVPIHDICALADHMERVIDPVATEAVPDPPTLIAIADPLVSNTPDNCIKELEKQLKSWRPIYRSNADTRRLTYSGRVDNDGKVRKHLQDDLCLALQLLSYWSTAIRQHKMAHFNYNRV